jgi:hypothetical protein
MKRIAGVVLAVVAGAMGGVRADTFWTWSFSTESGTISASGDLVNGVPPPGRYTTDVSTLTVLTSFRTLNLGTGYSDGGQPPQGFDWDGTNVTAFWRQGGVFMNGANYYWSGSIWYTFIPPPSSATLFDMSHGNWASGSLTFRPAVTSPPVIVAFDSGVLTWTNSVSNRIFRVESRSDLVAEFPVVWEPFKTLVGTGTTTQIQIPLQTNGFYRVLGY